MATYLPVTDPDDPRIEPYRAVRDRDLRDLHGERFVAEGESVIRVLLSAASRYEVESLLVAETRRHVFEAELADEDVPVYVAAQAVMDRIVGFPIHRGLLALGRRGEPAYGPGLLAGARLAVGLVGVANHDNMGGVFRNAAAFGADAVLLDSTCCDPFYRKALRVSVGGVLAVPHARVASGVEIVALCEDAGMPAFALSPNGDLPLEALDLLGPAAIILGTEGPGLPDAVLSRCATVRIDMAAGFDSLNLATTSGIALYELSRQLRALPPPRRRRRE